MMKWEMQTFSGRLTCFLTPARRILGVLAPIQTCGQASRKWCGRSMAAHGDRCKGLFQSKSSAPVYGTHAVDTIYSELNNAAVIPDLPKAIYRASKGSYAALTALAQDGLSPDALSWGMRYSVWCADGAPLDNPTIVDRQTYDAYPLFDGEISAAFNPAICVFWKVPAAAASEWLPLTSSIPTMIFAGEYDPNTPPSWGRRALRTLKNAYMYEFPSYSHRRAAQNAREK